jgi:hypothetical protein
MRQNKEKKNKTKKRDKSMQGKRRHDKTTRLVGVGEVRVRTWHSVEKLRTSAK